MYYWNLDNIKIPDVMSVSLEGNATIVGTASKFNPSTGYQFYTWKAFPTPQGWFVELETPAGRIGSFQGATFNLGLEVAAAIKRIG